MCPDGCCAGSIASCSQYDGGLPPSALTFCSTASGSVVNSYGVACGNLQFPVPVFTPSITAAGCCPVAQPIGRVHSGKLECATSSGTIRRGAAWSTAVLATLLSALLSAPLLL